MKPKKPKRPVARIRTNFSKRNGKLDNELRILSFPTILCRQQSFQNRIVLIISFIKQQFPRNNVLTSEREAQLNIYYLAGFMAKKFQSIVFYRAGISLSALFYFAAILTSRFLEDLESHYFNSEIALSAFISVVILIIFLFSAPFFMRHLNSGEWMDDTYRVDVTHESRISAKLRDYNLSPREIETCQNLLEGYTLRQTGAIMGISFSTVNTYCTSIYKKLNINSRTELVVLLKEYSKK